MFIIVLDHDASRDSGQVDVHRAGEVESVGFWGARAAVEWINELDPHGIEVVRYVFRPLPWEPDPAESVASDALALPS